jgi:hypothetical protein
VLHVPPIKFDLRVTHNRRSRSAGCVNRTIMGSQVAGFATSRPRTSESFSSASFRLSGQAPSMGQRHPSAAARGSLPWAMASKSVNEIPRA